MNFNFEIITIGDLTKIKIKTQENLLHLLASNCELWQKLIIKNNSIVEADGSLTCSITTLSTSTDGSDKNYIKFLLIATGKPDKIEPFRLKLLDFISSQSFEQNYVIRDDFSKQIACEIYPLINDLENLLRGYIIRFFIEKIGTNWWNLTADAEMRKKVSQRKNNEKDFSKYIDNRIYLIDFGELGKMVYSLSSGYISKEDIIRKINTLEESPEAIKSLKQELQSNYSKFFETHFKNNKFQQKWEGIENIRNKVAHNNLFTQNDLDEARLNCNELLKIINDAKKEIENIRLTPQEIQSMQEKSFYESNPSYGEFIRLWTQLELLTNDILADKNIKGNTKFLSTTEKSYLLEKNQIIDKILANKINYFRGFRNQLVRGVNLEFIEDNIAKTLIDLETTFNELENIKK